MTFDTRYVESKKYSVHLLGSEQHPVRSATVRPSVLMIANYPITINIDPLLTATSLRHSVSTSSDLDSAPLTDFATHIRLL
jgi:hypothetical protein